MGTSIPSGSSEASADGVGISMGGRAAGIVTVGTFDGLHRGHQVLLERVRERSSEVGGRSVLVSFDRHPQEILEPSAVPALLTPWAEKVWLLSQLGVDELVVLPFTARLAEISSKEFVERVLLGGQGMTELVVGYDHALGRGRSGDVETLRVLSRELDYRLEVVPPLLEGEEPVSSSRIRAALQVGDLAYAHRTLGRPYSFLGRVVAGAGRGKALERPTANLELLDRRKLLPPQGVYAVLVEAHGGGWKGLLHFGSRPTFGEPGVRPEVHLLEFEGDLYGQILEVQFVGWIREPRSFDSSDALQVQMARDEEDSRRVFEELGVG